MELWTTVHWFVGKDSLGDHLFSTYVKFLEKFFFSFLEKLAYVLDELYLGIVPKSLKSMRFRKNILLESYGRLIDLSWYNNLEKSQHNNVGAAL